MNVSNTELDKSSEEYKRWADHGLMYIFLIHGILNRAACSLTPWKLQVIPHIADDYACLEFKRNAKTGEILSQKMSESEQLVYLSLIAMPIENLWVEASIQRNIITRNILEVSPEYIAQRNDYIYENYENQFPLTNREVNLLPEYAIHLWVKYSLNALEKNPNITSGRIVFLSLPFVAAALRSYPLDIYTQRQVHAGINPFLFVTKLLNRVREDELTGDQKLLFEGIKEKLQ